MPELLLSQRLEVPVYGGSGRDLLSSFAGDAAHQESSSGHGFSQGVHLCTAAMTLRHCREEEEEDMGTEKIHHLNGQEAEGGVGEEEDLVIVLL